MEKIFADGEKIAKFVKVFSLESFPLYGMCSTLHCRIPLIGRITCGRVPLIYVTVDVVNNYSEMDRCFFLVMMIMNNYHSNRRNVHCTLV